MTDASDAPDSRTLAAEAAHLTLPRFDETTALTLGLALVHLARAENLPVVINIRTADRTLFHAAMPGATALNDLWVRRKSNTALLFAKASLRVGTEHRERGETLARHGLPPQDYADAGGAVPITVAGVGVVAVVTVSGLPQLEDHRLAMRAITALPG